MKVLTKVLAIVLAATMLCFVFASCADTVSGTYAGELDLGVAKAAVEYKFSGSKVTITYTAKILGVETSKTLEGTYKIETKDEKKTMTITLDTKDDNAAKFSGSHSYEKGDGFIKLDGVQLNKK